MFVRNPPHYAAGESGGFADIAAMEIIVYDDHAAGGGEFY
jgi:hypothetical protein